MSSRVGSAMGAAHSASDYLTCAVDLPSILNGCISWPTAEIPPTGAFDPKQSLSLTDNGEKRMLTRPCCLKPVSRKKVLPGARTPILGAWRTET